MHSAEISIFTNNEDPTDIIIQVRRGYGKFSGSSKETKNFMMPTAAAEYYSWAAVAGLTNRRLAAGCDHYDLYAGRREYQQKVKRRVLTIFKRLSK